jgi:hypothetical protein
MEKAADTQASPSATMSAASLTGVIERRVTVVRLSTAAVTVGVTDVVAMISSALRRIWPASCHAFKRRPARIRFQPHWRASSAALAFTRPSGCDRSQASASKSSNGRVGRVSVMRKPCPLSIVDFE